MKRRLIASAFLVSVSAIGGGDRAQAVADSVQQRQLILKPAVYDPFRTSTVKAEWKRGIGLPDEGGSSAYGFRLWKSGPATAREMALGELRGVTGLRFTGLAFDAKRPEGPAPPSVRCSFASPRFQILTNYASVSTQAPPPFRGFMWVQTLGCAQAFNVGTPAPGWITLWFSLEELLRPPPAGASDAVFFLVRMTLVLDEPGELVLDNIRVNDLVITKPGFTGR